MPAGLSTFHSEDPKLKEQQVGQSTHLAIPNQGYSVLGIRTTTPLSARDVAGSTEPQMSRVNQNFCNLLRGEFESSS